jgi:hypothetical protein
MDYDVLLLGVELLLGSRGSEGLIAYHGIGTP